MLPDATVPDEEPPRRVSYGCLVGLLFISWALIFIAAFIFNQTPLDPPPAELVPVMPGHVVVRCEVTEHGSIPIEAQDSVPATRLMLISAEGVPTQALMRDIASAFANDGWAIEEDTFGEGWKETSPLEDRYFLQISTYESRKTQDLPCDPGVDPEDVELIEVIISDYP